MLIVRQIRDRVVAEIAIENVTMKNQSLRKKKKMKKNYYSRLGFDRMVIVYVQFGRFIDNDAQLVILFRPPFERKTTFTPIYNNLRLCN